MDKKLLDTLFSPSKDMVDENGEKLFGFTVSQQGPKLIMSIKIHQEKRRDEIIGKIKVMAIVAEELMSRQGIKRVCVVDSNEVLDQLSKYQIGEEELFKMSDEEKATDVTIEAIDIIRGDLISIEYAMRVMMLNRDQFDKIANISKNR